MQWRGHRGDGASGAVGWLVGSAGCGVMMIAFPPSSLAAAVAAAAAEM